jgi:hypothetical protein
VDRVRARFPALKPGATALAAVALADMIFAVDSVPAILAITPDTFTALTLGVIVTDLGHRRGVAPQGAPHDLDRSLTRCRSAPARPRRPGSSAAGVRRQRALLRLTSRQGLVDHDVGGLQTKRRYPRLSPNVWNLWGGLGPGCAQLANPPQRGVKHGRVAECRHAEPPSSARRAAPRVATRLGGGPAEAAGGLVKGSARAPGGVPYKRDIASRNVRNPPGQGPPGRMRSSPLVRRPWVAIGGPPDGERQ